MIRGIVGRLRQRPQTQQPEATNTPLPLDPDHRGQVLDDLQSQIVAAWSQSSAEFKESVRQILDRVLDEIDPETSQVSGVGDHRPITFSRKAVMGIVTAISLILVAVAVVLALVLPASNPVSLAAPTTFPTLLPGVSQRSVAVAPYLPVTPPAPTLPIPGPQPSDVATAEVEVETAFTTVYGHEPDSQKLVLLQGGADPAVVASGDAAGKAYPQISAGSTPVVLGVVFTYPSDAAVLYEIVYRGQPTVGPKIGYAILDDGTWKVTRATYCQDTDNAGTGVRC